MINDWKEAAAIAAATDRSARSRCRVFPGQSLALGTAGDRSSHRQRDTRRVHVSELMLPPASVWTGVLLCFGAAIFPLKTAGQSIVPSGVEKTISGARNGDQSAPAVSVDGDGGFVVWEDNTIETSHSSKGIAAVRLGPDWSVTGAPFQVNSQTSGNQEKPQSLLLANSRALVTWESKAANKSSIFGRVLSRDGTLLSGEFLINPTTTVTNFKQQVSWTGIFRNRTKTRKYKFKESYSFIREHAGGASLVALPDGGAIVAYHAVRRTYTNTFTLVRESNWNGVRSMTNDYLRPILQIGDWMQDVFLQRIDSEGNRVGSAIQVNQYDRFNQRDPSIALLANGNVIVTWVSERPQTGWALDNFALSLYAREMTTAGDPVGAEFMVGEDPARASANPVIATLGSGFGIYWSQHESVGTGRWNVYGRVFSAAGVPAGEPFLVNVHTEGNQYAPRVSSGPARFIVWTSLGQDGSREGVYGRTLVNGVPEGNEVGVNTTIGSRQHQPSVSGSEGRVISVWSTYSGEQGFDLSSQVYVIGDAK